MGFTNTTMTKMSDSISPRERQVLHTFNEFLMTPRQMLCFSGPEHERHVDALETMVEKDLLVEEGFAGGYSLTESGFEAMKACEGGC